MTPPLTLGMVNGRERFFLDVAFMEEQNKQFLATIDLGAGGVRHLKRHRTLQAPSD